MSLNNKRRVLAIALDAAEPTLVRRLIDQGGMPALRSLLARGRWLRVASAADIGSGAVWPTFITGAKPQTHGIYGEWLWNGESMNLTRYAGDDLNPFWKSLADAGISVGILDVPFMPVVGLASGFEVSEWGPHDIVKDKTISGPASVAKIVSEYSPHPLQSRVQIEGPHDYESLQALGEICMRGIKARGELARRLIKETDPQFAIVAFNEIHRSAHYLWRAVEPNHAIYSQNGFAELRATKPGLNEIYRAIDREIGELIAGLAADAFVTVFSLHGMRPTHGTPAFLPELLCEMGFARMKSRRDQNWSDRPKAWFGAFKRRTPAGLKKLYYNTLPARVTHQLARPNMMPLYDWPHTRAFSLPTDQNGWVRLNLVGREAEGVVARENYQETCEAIEERLRNLRTENGEALISEVFRTADDVAAAQDQRLPDLVIHWADAVFTTARIADSQTKLEFAGRKYVGQHAREGFCIVPTDAPLGEEKIRAEDFHALFTSALAN